MTTFGQTTQVMDADQDLISRIRAGDERAFEVLVRSQGARMLAVAGRFFKCNDDAEDAVQDAFISAFKSFGSFEGSSRLTTWLHRIVVNACLMKLRSRREHISIDALLPSFQSDGHHAVAPRAWDEHDGFARASAAETRAIVRACIEELPDSYREVLIVRDIEEVDTRDAAKMLDCSIANVKTRLHRARQALRTLLERRLAISADDSVQN